MGMVMVRVSRCRITSSSANVPPAVKGLLRLRKGDMLFARPLDANGCMDDDILQAMVGDELVSSS